jgi:hypothetical protein
MEVGAEVQERIDRWASLSRWDKSELGRDLRRPGRSYREITDLIPVKKSTLATWCREVVLSAEQHGAIKARTGSVVGIPRDTQWKRRQEVELIRAQASLEAEHLVEDPLWSSGVTLYWGEGFKTQNQLGMANADPYALRMFINWADRYLQPSTGFRARLNLHANDEPTARVWWASELSLPLSDFTKSFIKPDGTGHRKNHLPSGVCLVTKRRSADAFHATMAWVDFMRQRFGQ